MRLKHASHAIETTVDGSFVSPSQVRYRGTSLIRNRPQWGS